MTVQSPTAWFLSLALHAFVALVVAFLAYTASLEAKKHPQILELVAGEGDNFMATAAPALGETGGVSVEVPKVVETPPAPAPAAPPEITPVVPAPTPIAPAPQAAAPAPTPTKAPGAVPDFSKQIRWQIIRGESTGKLRAKRERDAELKRQAAEKKRLAEEAKKMTKAEFDAKNKAKSAKSTSKNAPVKVAKIDAQGIAKGVVGGSTANTKGGASGKALTSDNADVMAGYYTYFREEVRRKFEPPPGLSDTLKATVLVRNFADGTLGTAKIARTSGSREFDRAVLDAVAQVRMPPRPDRKSEEIDFIFTMKERNED